MVHIPTTQRQFYNTTPKVNTLGAFAGALQPAAKQYQEEMQKQQDIKIDTNTTKARLELDNLNNQWRLANQANPDNPEAKMQLQNDMQEVLARYGNDIDASAKMKWNIAANKLSSAYELSNNQWSFQQRAQNTKLDVAENINANLQLARNAGRSGDLESGLGDYVNSYNQLFKYASQNMGATEAKALLMDYEEDYMTSFINGLAEKDPQAALEALKQPEIAASFKKEGAQETMMNIVNKQISLQNFQRKVSEFNNEVKLSSSLDDMPTLDALHLLEQNEGNVSTEYYKAKKKALMSAAGIDAETQADEAAEIMLDIAGLPKEDGAETYYTASNDILTKIEDKYSRGLLSTSDRKKLINQVSKGQGKNISSLKGVGSGLKFWDFSYKDASKYIDKRYTGPNSNQILLEYFRQVDGQDLDNDQKKEVLNNLIKKENTMQLNNAISESEIISFATMDEAKQAFSQGKIKKGDKVIINGVKGTI